jgi:Trk-type K+ transport system membrane component
MKVKLFNAFKWLISTAISTWQYFLSLLHRKERVKIRTVYYNKHLEQLRELSRDELAQELSRTKRIVSTLKIFISTFGILFLTGIISFTIFLLKSIFDFYLRYEKMSVTQLSDKDKSLAVFVTIGLTIFALVTLIVIIFGIVSLFSRKKVDVEDLEKIILEKNGE